jgi:hypothetical protein
MLNPIHLTRFSLPRALAVFLAVASLVACSGGGGGSNFGPRVDQEAGGVWIGTITSDNVAGPLSLAGVVTETGEVQFTSEDGSIVYTGTIQVRGDEITGTLEGVNFAGIIPGALPAGAIDIEGTVTSQGTITGSYTGANDSGTFSVNYSDSYERTADVGKLASDWASFGDLAFKSGVGGVDDNLLITVDGAGVLTGGDTSGCSYDGNFSVDDPNVNAYDVQIDISDCGGLDGAYTGVATLTDDAGENDTLAVSASSMAIAIAFTVDRVSSRSASGLWGGTIASDAVMGPAELIFGIISEDGESQFVVADELSMDMQPMSDAQLAGSANVSGNFFDSSFDAFAVEGDLFPDGTSFGAVELTGTVETADALSLSYNGVGDTGLIEMIYLADYEDGSSLATVEDDWTGDNSLESTVNVTVNAAGTITGTDDSGCTYAGAIAIIDANFNAYDVTLTVAGCTANGDYDGLATIQDGAVEDDTLVILVANSQIEEALTLELVRVDL